MFTGSGTRRAAVILPREVDRRGLILKAAVLKEAAHHQTNHVPSQAPCVLSTTGVSRTLPRSQAPRVSRRGMVRNFPRKWTHLLPVVVVEWLIFLKESLLLEELTLVKNCSLISAVKSVFCSRPIETVTFLWNDVDLSKWVVDLSSGKRHIPKTNHGKIRGFHRKSYINNAKWKPLEILHCLNVSSLFFIFFFWNLASFFIFRSFFQIFISSFCPFFSLIFWGLFLFSCSFVRFLFFFVRKMRLPAFVLRVKQ